MKIEAEICDATHLVLSQPLTIPVGRRVVVEVIEEEVDGDRDEFLVASSTLLERAYGCNEPDYADEGEAL